MGRATAFCIHPIDLAVSKLMAGREKDIAFVKAMLKNGLTTKSQISACEVEMLEGQRERLTHQLELL